MCSGAALLAVLKELLRNKGGSGAKTQSTEALCCRESQHWSLLKRCGTRCAPASLAVALVELTFFLCVYVLFFFFFVTRVFVIYLPDTPHRDRSR